MDLISSKIVIIEDDESLGAALKVACERAGHTVLLAAKPDAAEGIFTNHTGIDYVICDCLLPGKPGVELIKDIKTKFPKSSFKVILTSGIFTDKQFVKEATSATAAIAFLKKPFEIEEALALIKTPEIAPAENRAKRKLLYQICENPNITAREKRKIIQSVDEVNGFDFPFLYSILAESKITGFLNIYKEDGAAFGGISYFNGIIVSVDFEDRGTVIGNMLIQNGYAVPEDVQRSLSEKQNDRLGSYMIKNNLLSPHAFDLILMEQMVNRLAGTVVDRRFKVNFTSAEVEMLSPGLDSENLTSALNDWIASKMSIDWLKSLYLGWSNSPITKSQAFNDENPALSTNLVSSLEGIKEKLNGKVTLAELLEMPGYNEAAVYKAIHFLISKGLIAFAVNDENFSAESQLKTLKNIWKEIENKSSYEIISYLETLAGNSSDESITKSFARFVGPRPDSSHSEALLLWSKVLQIVEEATAMATDVTKVEEAKQVNYQQKAEAKLKAVALMDIVKKELQFNNFKNAQLKIAEIEKLNTQVAQFYIYSSWAKLGAMEVGKPNPAIKDIEFAILQIPPEERYDELFSFVNGLLLKAKGDVVGAKRSFEKSIALNPSFMPAKREMVAIENLNKRQDVFTMDLKDVVTGFFKKR